MATAIAHSLLAGYFGKKLAPRDPWNYDSMSDARDPAGHRSAFDGPLPENLERPWQGQSAH